MILGVPRETKAEEYRVGLLPVGVRLLVADGHAVVVERSAGAGSGRPDEEYLAAGATIAQDAAEVYARAELIIKVKEPQPEELPRLRKGQTLFCFLHFAASRELTRRCLQAGITALAYETLHDRAGRLPMLTPMSEIAGRMAVQQGATYLQKPAGGRGVLLGGVAGVESGQVLVLGGGTVGANAARVAAAMGASVVVMDIDLDRLRYLRDVCPPNVQAVYCDPDAVQRHAVLADLVVGAVLIPGRRAPLLIDEPLLKRMKEGAVLADVCVDQGGCAVTSRPTTHRDPTFVAHGIVHYCVSNMPGAVPRTSTGVLCSATLPYVRQLANLGVEAFASQSPGHAAAVNLRDGRIIHPAVAAAFPDLPGA